jgi:hypothetical protein
MVTNDSQLVAMDIDNNRNLLHWKWLEAAGQIDSPKSLTNLTFSTFLNLGEEGEIYFKEQG